MLCFWSFFILFILNTCIHSAPSNNRRSVNTKKTNTLSFGPVLPHATFSHPLPSTNYAPLTGYLSEASVLDPLTVAFNYLNSIGISRKQLALKDSYKTNENGVWHGYFRQVINGLEVLNGDLNVNVDRLGRVIAVGNSFFQGPLPSSLDTPPLLSSIFQSRPSQTPDQATYLSFQTHHFTKYHFTTGNTANRMRRNWITPMQALQFLFTKLSMQTEASSAVILEESNLDTASSRKIQFRRLYNYSKEKLIFKLTDAVTAEGVKKVTLGVGYLQMWDTESSQIILKPVYDIELEANVDWYNSHICSQSGDVLSLINWTADSNMPIFGDENAANSPSQLFSPDLFPPQSVLGPDFSPKDGTILDAPLPIKQPRSSYRVYPIGTLDPTQSRRELVRNPFDVDASPFGWHVVKKSSDFTASNRFDGHDPELKDRDEEDGMVVYRTTKGNNVYAHENLKGEYSWENNYRPNGGRKLKFDYDLDLKSFPKEYLDAAITQLFYICNMMHDISYNFGFTEEAGNFQEHNFGRGGKGADAVIANAQDGSGYNNANFATPPDGQRGKMRMYVWNVVSPYRDGDLENDIIMHEYGHGISTRLTGGPSNSGCLGWGESGGMGEGWSDIFAVILNTNVNSSRDDVFEMGKYANGGHGIRKYPYSADLNINPSLYSYLSKPGYWGVHAKGEVWAVILLEVYWNLIDSLSFTSNWYTKTRTHGNTIYLSLLLLAMKLQPCRPSFIDARDAMILADEVMFNGMHICLLWKGFAKRGLGIDAVFKKGKNPWDDDFRKDGFKLPEECA